MPVVGFTRSRKAFGPDPVLVKEQLQCLQNMYRVYGAETFSRFMFWILRKNPEKGERSALPAGFWNRRLVPFVWNNVQRDIWDKHRERNILLKMRQGGYTTWEIIVRLYLPCILEPGSGGLLISQNNSYAQAHFHILRRAHRYLGAVNPYDTSANLLTQQLHDNLLHLGVTRSKELVFDQLDSRIRCDSAEVEEVGQGLTLNHVVCSETSRWPGNPEETLANMKEAIAAGGTLDIECTANGLGGYFYEECMRSRDRQNKDTEFQYHFHEWWWHEEYRSETPAKLEELDNHEKELMAKFKLDLYQIAWRKKKVIALRHNFDEKYPEDDITCFLVSGSTFFDRDILRHRLLELSNFKPVLSHRNGEFVIFKKRVKGRHYIIGADTAEGKLSAEGASDDPDFSYAKVIDRETGEEMARFRARTPPEDFAQDLAEIGREYNNALIAVERNNHGGTVIVCLEVQCHYTALFKMKEWWKRERKKVIEILGWPTTPKTRPLLLNRLAYFIRENPDLIYDKIMIEEGLRFVRNPKNNKLEAAPGSHDDGIFASGIAHMVRLMELGYFDPLFGKSEKYGETPQESAEDEADAA